MKREDFKFLKKAIYLDSAAGTLKPNNSISELVSFYNDFPINPHSIDSAIGFKLREKIDNCRKLIAELVGSGMENVIFTSGTTDSLNRVAEMMTNKLSQGDEILLSNLNHSSNVVPWLELAKKTKAKVIFSNNVIDDISSKTKIVSISQMDNTIGETVDIERIHNLSKKKHFFLINDAAQAISHQKVNSALADFTVFSANKLYGPTGLGFLVIRNIESYKPVRFGGGANVSYNNNSWVPKNGVEAFEAGTPNTAGIVMMNKTMEYINSIGLINIWDYEKEISIYAYDKLSGIKGIELISPKGSPILLFNIKGFHSQDVVSSLGHKNIILRSGEHCVRTLEKVTGKNAWIRISLALYNDKDDIDKVFEEIKNGGDFLEFI